MNKLLMAAIFIIGLYNCKSKENLEYLILSHLYLYQGDKCFIDYRFCKLAKEPNCQLELEACILWVDKHWKETKERNNL